MNDTVVLDTSAIFAFLQDEDGADTVAQILELADKRKCVVVISFVTVAELLYVTWQEEGESIALELVAGVKPLPITVRESEETLTLLAGRIKANGKLSLGDAFVAATALQCKGTWVHKNPEFEFMSDLIDLHALPYKNSAKRSSKTLE